MADGQLGPGMSDFGLSKPSQSNSVGQDNPALVEFLKSVRQLESPAARAEALQKRREQLEGTPDQTIIDKLGATLLPALLGGGLAIAGQGAAGAGMALGGLNAADLLAKEENQAKREALKQTLELEEQQLQRLDKIHNRMNQLVIANPEAFIDPESGQQTVTPEMLGFLASGLDGLPFNATTKGILARRNSDKAWAKRYEMAMDGLQQAPNEAEAARWATRIQVLLGDNPNSGITRDMVSALNDPENARTAIQNLVGRADPDSVVGALAWLTEQGLKDPMDDPVGFSSRLTFSLVSAGGRVPLKEDLTNQAILRVNKWMKDPENADAITEIRQKFGLNTDETTRAIVENALVDEPTLRDSYMSLFSRWNKDGLTDAQVLSMIQREMQNVDALDLLIDESLQGATGITPEDVAGRAASNIDKLLDLREKRSDTSIASSYVTLRQKAKVQLRDAGYALSDEDMRAIFEQAKAIVQAEQGLGPDDRLPFQAIEAEFNEIISVLIANQK